MTTPFMYRVGLDGVDAAVNGLRTVKGAQDQVANGLRDNVGQGAQQAAQHLQGAASAVANLATRIGSPGVTTGANLIGSVAGSTAQFAAMGSMIGPGGTFAGAIAGAILGIVGLATAHHDAAAEAEAHAVAEGHVASGIRDAARAAADAASGTFGSDTSSGALTTARDTEAARAQELSLALSRAQHDQYGRTSEAIRDANRAAITLAHTELLASRATLANIDEEIARRQDLEAVTQADAEARRVASELAAEEARRTAEIVAADAEEREGIAARHAIEDQEAAARAASAADALAAQAAMDENLAGARERFAAAEAQAKAEGNLLIHEQIALEEELRRAQTPSGNESSAAAIHVEELSMLREKAEAYHTLALAADDASIAFGTGYVSSIDQVIESYRQLQNAAKATGRSVGIDSRLMERSLVASGNAIAETVGGDMKGAFTEALGAWLDGSVSFVEAAENMAKGVIKALVMESIVQAVVEGARAIASIASQDYVGAASHAAAAGAWAAVAVVAGGVGAATGSFGGGGGAESGSSGVGADANRERSRDRDSDRGGPETFIIMPGGFITARDVQRGIVDALDQADREGVRPRSAGR